MLDLPYGVLTRAVSLISPLGQHRRDHVVPSKGKRKRKKAPEISSGEREPVPDAPLATFVDVGLSAISRVLEKMSSSTQPPDNHQASYSVIFVARSGQSAAFTSHLPQMVAAASQSHPGRPPIRLVGFSKACEDRLSSCMGIPRASSIALRTNAPQSSSLIEYVLARCPPVEVAWLEEAKTARHRETKVVTSETTVGVKRQKKS